MSNDEVAYEAMVSGLSRVYYFVFPTSITYVTSFSLQYSFFCSILTIGGTVGAAISGKLTDVIGR